MKKRLRMQGVMRMCSEAKRCRGSTGMEVKVFGGRVQEAERVLYLSCKERVGY